MTTHRSPEASAVLKARIAGALYVGVIVTAGFAEAFARGKLVVSGDAAATAANIVAHESLYRLGGAADVLNLAFDGAIAILLYSILRPAGRTLALITAVYRLMGDGMVAVAALAHFAPLVFLTNAPHSQAFSSAQLQEQAFAWLRVHSQAYTISMVFFGIHCVLLGCLIYRSTFLPRLVGVLLVVSGTCYVTNSFARFVAPVFAGHLFPYILLPGLVAEASLALWLLVAGVDAGRWKERAAAP